VELIRNFQTLSRETVLQKIWKPPSYPSYEAFQRAALASLRTMMRLIAHSIIATPVSGRRS
jgi:phosphatidylserine decarboxylase